MFISRGLQKKKIFTAIRSAYFIIIFGSVFSIGFDYLLQRWVPTFPFFYPLFFLSYFNLLFC